MVKSITTLLLELNDRHTHIRSSCTATLNGSIRSKQYSLETAAPQSGHRERSIVSSQQTDQAAVSNSGHLLYAVTFY
jgi:hypothetical protein